LHRGGAPEDRNLHADLLFLGLHLLHGAGEVRERSVDDADLVARLERDTRLRLHGAFDDDLAKIIDLRGLHLLRALVANEPGDFGRVLYEVPDLFGHLHLYEDVAGEAGLLAHAGLAARPSLLNRLGGNEDLTEA